MVRGVLLGYTVLLVIGSDCSVCYIVVLCHKNINLCSSYLIEIEYLLVFVAEMFVCLSFWLYGVFVKLRMV